MRHEMAWASFASMVLLRRAMDGSYHLPLMAKAVQCNMVSLSETCSLVDSFCGRTGRSGHDRLLENQFKIRSYA